MFNCKLYAIFRNTTQSFIQYSFLFLLSLNTVGFILPPIIADENADNNQQQIPVLTVNINKASAAEIADVMTGIGMKKATVIVEYREKTGGFKSLDDLLQVKGIGPATLKKNRHRLTL